MRIQKSWSALLLVALVGCSDAPGKEESPIVVRPNNTNSTANNAQTNNAQTNNTQTNNTQTNNTPDPMVAVLDLRVDTNRDGLVDFENPAEDGGEEAWTSESGAVFLPNIDDDDRSCATSGNDTSLASCHDAIDEAVDGPEDLLDMAPIKLRATGLVPDEATAQISVINGERVRFFREVAGQWTKIDLTQTTFTGAELRAGIELRMEGKDIMRDPAIWDGRVRLSASMQNAPEGSVVTDDVEMRVSPLILRHHLDPVVEMFSSELGVGGDGAFTQDLRTALGQLGLGDSHYELPVEDQWTQDFIENAYLMAPGADGPRVIQVYIRSANVEMDFSGRRGLRAAGRIVYTGIRGPNRAGITQFTAQRSLEWDTLNSFGNTETIPPHPNYPLGRIIRGEARSYNDKGDSEMIKLLSAQGVQTPLFVDTGWLLVAHIDETVSFVKDATSPLGWSLLANDASAAVQLLQNLAQQGQGQSTMFQGKRWISDFGREYSASLTVNAALQDPDVMGASAEAAVEVDDQVSAIKAATGLTDANIIGIPFTHMTMGGASIAHQPGIVNGIVIDDKNYFAPRPYGPIVNGVDTLVAETEAKLATIGYSVKWIEDWDMYHRLAGEIHCASNTTRAVPADTRWWEEVQ